MNTTTMIVKRVGKTVVAFFPMLKTSSEAIVGWDGVIEADYSMDTFYTGQPIAEEHVFSVVYEYYKATGIVAIPRIADSLQAQQIRWN